MAIVGPATLLPCLAFTSAALALGQFVGLARACAGLAVVWTAAVVVPSLAAGQLSVALEPVSLPVWAATAAVAAATVLVRQRALAYLAGRP